MDPTGQIEGLYEIEKILLVEIRLGKERGRRKKLGARSIYSIMQPRWW